MLRCIFNNYLVFMLWMTVALSVEHEADEGTEKSFGNILPISSKIPYFESNTPLNLTVQIKTHAFLPCKVYQLGNKSVSWIRMRDSHILTVDRYTFIADERFQILHSGDSWTLQIKYVQERDEGPYECQVTSEPKISYFVSIEVVVPQTRILGEGDIFVKSGSSVQIRCIISQCLESPSYIFWYHEGVRVLENHPKHMWIERVNADTTIGTLMLKSAEKKDGGNYTCAPSSLDAASVMLHVLNGEHPAAMQQSKCSQVHTSYTYNFLLIINSVTFLYPLRLLFKATLEHSFIYTF